jgi:hypothetical protein
MASGERLKIGYFNDAADRPGHCSSKNRDEIHRALKNHKGSFGIHFTGQLPKNTGILF